MGFIVRVAVRGSAVGYLHYVDVGYINDVSVL
jgi:hypothetical protein